MGDERDTTISEYCLERASATMFFKPGSLHGGPGQRRRHDLRVCGEQN